MLNHVCFSLNVLLIESEGHASARLEAYECDHRKKESPKVHLIHLFVAALAYNSLGKESEWYDMVDYK